MFRLKQKFEVHSAETKLVELIYFNIQNLLNSPFWTDAVFLQEE